MEQRVFWLIGILAAVVLGLFVVGIVLAKGPSEPKPVDENVEQVVPDAQPVAETEPLVPEPTATHIETPTEVRAVYMSAWVASTPSMRDKIIKLVDESEINAVVIDIKDATGRVSFLVDDPLVSETGSPRALIKNINELTTLLHEKNIYVIGRISVFQDPYMTDKKTEWAIKSVSTGGVWKDRKGLSFLDPTNTHVWDYITQLSIASYNVGFDEINFDYIRFPSDGNIRDIAYPTNITSKADAIEVFFNHIDTEVRKKGIPTSADLFGMTTSNTDDLGIGQVLEKALPYFDYISPMIYPSHYPPNFNGLANPAAHPYEIVKFAMEKGVARAITAGFTAEHFRPWIQDFDMGATYTASMIKDQIRALEEQGIHSYMVWDPANTYTAGAYGNE